VTDSLLPINYNKSELKMPTKKKTGNNNNIITYNNNNNNNNLTIFWG